MSEIAIKALTYTAKLYAAMLVTLGGVAINAAGIQLGISSYNRPLTKMSFVEISKNLQTFATNLSDPKIQEETLKIIRSATGKVQEAIILLITLAQETATASSHEICKIPGINNICQVSELAHDILELGIDKVEQKIQTISSSSHVIQKGGASQEIQDMIHKKNKTKDRIHRSMSTFLNVSNNKDKDNNTNTNKVKDKNKTKKRN